MGPDLDESTSNQEITRNLSNRFRAFLSEHLCMRFREEGFAANLQGGTNYRFASRGIDWASMVVLDPKGDFSRVPFGLRTWRP